MKKLKTPFFILALTVLVIVGVYSSCKPKDKLLNLSVSMEITGWGYFNFDRGEKKHDDYFSKVTITNKEKTPVSFWMMKCSWWNETLIFDRDSIEFSAWGCDGNFPIEVELKPGKSIVFYPVFHPTSPNVNQLKIGFIMMKEDELTHHFKDWKNFIQSKNIYWSNPVSLKRFYNNRFKIED